MGLLGGGLITGVTTSAFGSPTEFRSAVSGITEEDQYWQVVRNQFLLPDDYLYLNTAELEHSSPNH